MWLLRIARFAAWSIAGLLLLWLLAWAGLPPLLKWQLEKQASSALGRQVSVQQVEFKPWTLELELRGLRVAGAQGQDDQFTLGRIHLDLELQSLLRLAPVLDAVEFEQPQLRLRHLGEGRYDIDDILQRLSKPEQPPSELPRFALFRFQLMGGAIDFSDDAVGRTQEVRELTLKLPFLSSLEQQREEAAEPTLNFQLNGKAVDASALLRPFAQARQGTGRLHAEGLDLAPYLPYWPAALPVRPTRGQLDLDLALRLPPGGQTPFEIEGRLLLRDAGFELQRADQAKALQLDWDSLAFEGLISLAGKAQTVNGSKLELAGLKLREGQSVPSRLERLLLEDWKLVLAEQRLQIARLQLDQPELQLQRDARARWNVEGWLPAPARAKAASQAAGKPVAQTAPASPWQLELGQLKLAGGRLSLLDQSAQRPVRLQLDQITLESSSLNLAPGKPAQLPLQLGLRLARDSASASAVGTLNYQGDLTLPGPGADGKTVPLAAKGRLELDDLPLHLLEPYFAAALNLDLLRAELGLRAQVDLSLPPQGLALQLRGDGEVNRLRTSTLDPAERLLDWKSLGLRDLQVELERGALARLKVAETVLSDYYARVVIDPQGRINLQQLLRQPAEASASATTGQATASGSGAAAVSVTAKPPAAAQPAASSALVEFGPITFVKGRVDFQDQFIRPNYSARLSELTGSMGGFSNQPSQAGAAPELAALSLRGKAEGQASLAIEGKLNPLAQPLALDIRAKVDDLELPPLSPYSIKYAGHGIERGKLGMEVNYQIAPDGQLQASNQILLKQLQFGERVEGSEAPNLPIRLAVSLLADSNGVIDLNLPVSGSINDPQFRVGPIIWRMVLGLIGKAITAPFALIAQAFGGAGDDFNQLDFALGSATLDEATLKRLQQVAQAMDKRADLRITLEGQSMLERERSAYQQAQLQQRLLEEKRRQLARSGKPVDPLDQIETPTPAEAARLLKEVYRRADIPKPRNLIGLARELPATEMEKLLLATIAVDADRMRELALARTAAVRDELVRLGISNDRIYLLAPSSPEAGQGDSWRPSVILGLRQE